MEYRGFQVYEENGSWWATAGGGLLNLGPFDTEADAKEAVDRDLDG